MNFLAKVIIACFNDFAPNKANVVLRGSANSKPLGKTKLRPPYHSPEFQNIKIWSYNPPTFTWSFSYFEVGNYFTNIELPNLRAAFMRNTLITNQEIIDRKLQETIKIANGEVTDTPYKTDVNCQVFLSILEDR